MGNSSCVTKCTLQLEHNVGGGSMNVVREDIVKIASAVSCGRFEL